MTENFETLPSQNPAENDNMEGFARLLGDKLAMNLEKMLPCEVISYDRPKNRAVLKPLINCLSMTNQSIPRAILPDIPVFVLSGGGLMLSFPLQKGDKGWVISNDRDISQFKTSLAQGAPNTVRKHQFIDGVFFPDKINNLIFNPEDEDAFILSDGADSVFSFKTGLLKIAQTMTKIKGDIVQTGDLTSSGTITGAIMSVGNGATGIFKNSVTVENGIVIKGT